LFLNEENYFSFTKINQPVGFSKSILPATSFHPEATPHFRQDFSLLSLPLAIMKGPEQIILLLGSNQDDPAHQLATARDWLAKKIAPLQKVSKVYQTEAWGLEDQPDFLNQVVVLHSTITPRQLLDIIHQIEGQLGRVREERWGPRPIDIDILFYGDQIIDEEGLHIPHRGIPNRNFTLIPLLELLADFLHPELGKTIEELYLESKDPLEVIQLDPA
jgi:2-amino-4-hydroxy-6-hydroxymethyldihydropteridine diphosphokinase